MENNNKEKKLPFSIGYKKAFEKWRKATGIELSSNGIFILKILIEHANNKSGIAFPTVKTITEASQLSKSAVFTALKKLEQANLIKRRKRAGGMGFKRNEYRILLDEYLDQNMVKPVPSALTGDSAIKF